MSWQFERLSGPCGGVTEGPAWDGDALLFTHITASRILRFDPASGEVSVYREGTNCANGLMFDAQGRLYGCEGGAAQDARRVVRYEEDGVTVLADGFEGKRFNIPNDLAFDLQGRLWFTDPYYEGAAGPWSEDRGNKELDHDSVYPPRPATRWQMDDDAGHLRHDSPQRTALLFGLHNPLRRAKRAPRGREASTPSLSRAA